VADSKIAPAPAAARGASVAADAQCYVFYGCESRARAVHGSKRQGGSHAHTRGPPYSAMAAARLGRGASQGKTKNNFPTAQFLRIFMGKMQIVRSRRTMRSTSMFAQECSIGLAGANAHVGGSARPFKQAAPSAAASASPEGWAPQRTEATALAKVVCAASSRTATMCWVCLISVLVIVAVLVGGGLILGLVHNSSGDSLWDQFLAWLDSIVRK
ncbi:uncharacterized protein LOC113146700, partial [Cyclospora cayetanensis]|uniref:Uncharacterized protein LOC113146700 n=1 Tax=Cyclospora cayetanensis TaxID=88456 RepID=A0A6P6RSW1_9EIME